jgi:WD40 repeat protein
MLIMKLPVIFLLGIIASLISVEALSNFFSIFDVSSDGSLIAILNHNNRVQIWDVEQNKILRTVETTNRAPDVTFYYMPVSITFNPDDTRLAIGYETNLDSSAIDIFDVSAGKLLKQFETWKSVLDIVWHPKLNLMAVITTTDLSNRFPGLGYRS